MKKLLWLAMLTWPAAAQNQNPPFRLPDGVDLQRDLVYATIGTREMHLDLFLPKSGAGPFPAVVYIHGGGVVPREPVGVSAAGCLYGDQGLRRCVHRVPLERRSEISGSAL